MVIFSTAVSPSIPNLSAIWRIRSGRKVPSASIPRQYNGEARSLERPQYTDVSHTSISSALILGKLRHHAQRVCQLGLPTPELAVDLIDAL